MLLKGALSLLALSGVFVADSASSLPPFDPNTAEPGVRYSLSPESDSVVYLSNWALRSLYRLSESNIYDTLVISRVNETSFEIGGVANMTFMRVHLSSPYLDVSSPYYGYLDGASKLTPVSSHDLVVFETFEMASDIDQSVTPGEEPFRTRRSIGIQTFPKMEENAVRSFQKSSAEERMILRHETFEKLNEIAKQNGLDFKALETGHHFTAMVDDISISESNTKWLKEGEEEEFQRPPLRV